MVQVSQLMFNFRSVSAGVAGGANADLVPSKGSRERITAI